MSGRREPRQLHPESRSGNSCLGGTGHWPTALELSIGTPSVGRPLPARNERGEGWGEGKSNKNATPLPGPLHLLRRKRGRRARSIRLTQVQCTLSLPFPRGEGIHHRSVPADPPVGLPPRSPVWVAAFPRGARFRAGGNMRTETESQRR